MWHFLGEKIALFYYILSDLYFLRSLLFFCDTGLEYPEIRKFVLEQENVIYLKPKYTFKDVLEKQGYPLISKEQSQYIRQYRSAKSKKTKNTRWFGNKWGLGKISEKYKFLINAPFKISEKCCDIMKKDPSKKYEKETGRKPYIGTMATESNQRMTMFLKGECNAYNLKRPTSKPIIFWTDEDIWNYIKINKLKYSPIYDMGYKRTGCMFCLFGCQNKEENKFRLMKQTHPKLYDYCMTKLKLKDIIDYAKINCLD